MNYIERNREDELKGRNRDIEEEKVFYGTEMDGACFGCRSIQMAYQDTEKKVKPFSLDKKKEKNKLDRESNKNSESSESYSLISEYLPEILRGLQETKGVFIQGGTGCGKSTVVPKLLIEALNPKRLTVCTQPRRVSAVSIATRMMKNMSEECVGYSVRFQKKKGSRIQYVTEGVLLRELEKDKNLSRYSLVLIDEVHQKNTETLLLLNCISALARKRKDLYLVIMSANVDEEIIRETGMFPLVEIEKRRFSLSIEYLSSPSKNYIASIVEKVLEIERVSEHGNILVFLTGIEDISIVFSLLFGNIQRELFMLHSSLSMSQQMHAVRSEGRKCILATNIAESSITIPDVKYVVDSGLYKEVVYSPKSNLFKMITAPIQKPMAEQRAGRAGRTLPGTCFRIYTKSAYDSLHEQTISRLEIDQLENYILRGISLNVSLEPTERIIETIKRLEAQKLLSNHQILEKGKTLLNAPLSIQHALFIYEAKNLSCAWEASIIVSMMTVIYENISLYKYFISLLENRRSNEKSDHFLLFRSYLLLKKKNNNSSLVKKLDLIISQLSVVFSISNASLLNGCSSLYARIIKALSLSHTMNTLIKDAPEYRDTHTSVFCSISKYSSLSKENTSSKYLVYDRILDGYVPYAFIVSEIDFYSKNNN
ncbi:pre-mRNA-splicing factor ATP-dependent RNA helicase DHX16 [Nematocida sp. LUAm3]|nr:pre-mRNA-splicing factor ATP-dependent RNA helicase DHX16 [Nematocida sp. LUAm3]KAI5174534.1 pre-mRNA-splicing factor ATP-dependent RNA helicase DHX16 [Nematocida sp. LUAm2]KAI5178060.1 pre-mRNA-splicing factor ATP-dependent RNA helicase DHX16 [Nematocida sp. LUAm1]